MSIVRNIPWPRVLAEGVIIVVSILLAFAIDAWWSQRKSSENEWIYLSTLRSALVEQQSKIDHGLQHANVLRDATRRLLDAAVSSEASLADDELDRLLERLTWVVVSPVSPELNWLLSENSIGLVSDPALVTALGKLRFNLSEFEDTHTAARAFFYDVMMPYLRRRANLPQLNNISGAEPGTSDVFPAHKLKLTSRESH